MAPLSTRPITVSPSIPDRRRIRRIAAGDYTLRATRPLQSRAGAECLPVVMDIRAKMAAHVFPRSNPIVASRAELMEYQTTPRRQALNQAEGRN